ncbi:homoaconitate hydratase family protein, partial [bacterium]|nr:homoaconitate hydratase family protein [candidate division CSSED10-310 bacterium]
QGMGDQDIAFAFKTGRTWFEVPHSIKVVFKGTPSPNVLPKDLVLAALRVLGTSKALGLSIEFTGEPIDALSLDGRITVASMVTEMAGIIGFIVPDDSIATYCRERSGRSFEIIKPDPDASYVAEIEVDVEGLRPLVAKPYKPTNVDEVRAVPDLKVDAVFIGSCTNGRMEDMEQVVRVCDRRQVAPWVHATIVPATREIYGEMLRRGYIQKMFDAGFIISNPGCGGCASGQIGMTGKGEVQLSTSNRNFLGKQGDGDTYLVSPATAAMSAMTGHLTEPA